MITTKWQAISAGLFFLVVFLSGFWLSRSGKPYSGILINVHKLVALAAVVLFVVTLVRLNRIAALGALEVAGGAVTVLLAIGLFVTGALVSIDHPMPPLVFTLHHLLPYLALLSTAATLYLLRGH
ncbi:MAG: hypothetical protein JW900_12985 [Anaerolineae bacterium]|nr:hypothetical protein [Anaerolineae bacterium]